MQATILTVGDELLIGHVIDSNAAWLARELNRLGIEVHRTVTVGDEVAAIQEALASAIRTSNVVIVTGGLGPTPDDVTRDALAKHFRVQLQVDEAVLERVRRRFSERGWKLGQLSASVARVPSGFETLGNAAGSAPGLWRRDATCSVAVVPGVPREMKTIFQSEIAPRLLALSPGRIVVHRTLRTVGVGESHLQAMIGDLSEFLDESLGIASLPSSGQVRLRISASGSDSHRIWERIARLETHLRTRIAPYIYGTDDDTLEGVVGGMLTERTLTVAAAESCTGGLLLHRLTNVSGSSAYVAGGVVAYANRVKTDILNVPGDLIESNGSVSEAVARRMAAGVRRHLSADIGVSITGIAGPSGGSPEKPVGTVWIGHADTYGTDARIYRFGTDRLTNKERSATAALDMVRKKLLLRRKSDMVF